MTERQLVSKFAKELREKSDIYFHVLSDTFGGHQKPFDAFACINGDFVAIEFKMFKGGKVEKHQIEALEKVARNGGYAFVFWFEEDKNIYVDYVFRTGDEPINGMYVYNKGWFTDQTPMQFFGALMVDYEHVREGLE